jgi:hypothetical protein
MNKGLYAAILASLLLGGCAGYVNDYKEYPELRQRTDNVQAPGDAPAGDSSSSSSAGNTGTDSK